MSQTLLSDDRHCFPQSGTHALRSGGTSVCDVGVEILENASPAVTLRYAGPWPIDTPVELLSSSWHIDSPYIQHIVEKYLRSAFDDVLQAASAEAQFAQMLLVFGRNRRIVYRDELVARIHELIRCAAEEDISPSPDSLRHLIGFLSNHVELTKPGLVLTPHGNFRAQWRKGRNKHFAVEFRPDGEVRYVLFRPNQSDPGRITRSSGSTTVDEIFDAVVLPTGVKGWAVSEG